MRNERGIALVFVLFLVTTVSALAVSLTFLANSETFASGNYRMATQARYGAESGVQKMANYLLDPMQYNPNLVAPGGLIDASNSPVKFNGNPVVLSSNSAQSNYPDAATVTAFSLASAGNLTAGYTNMAFSGKATLLSEYSFLDRFTGSPAVAQTWEITSDATIGVVHTATVEVVGMTETRMVPAINYGAFSIDPGCSSMHFKGNIGTDSYNSASLSGSTTPTYNSNGGDVGTNGNLYIEGSVDVKGDLYTPNTGVGTCTNGHITGLTEGGGATVSGNGDPTEMDMPKPLPKMVPFPTPTMPAYSTLGTMPSIGPSTCGYLGLTAAQCQVSGNTLTLTNTSATPMSLPQISLGSHENLILQASNAPGVSNEFIMNSLSLGAQSTLQVMEPTTPTPVIIKVIGKDSSGTDLSVPIDTTGGTVMSPNVSVCTSCSTFDARFMEFIYGGTGQIYMKGNAATAGVVYAPNASVDYAGTSDLYGAIIADKIYAHGTFNIHYDQRLQGDGWTLSAPMLTAFSWKNKFN
jgi:hypothetical protein